MVGAVVVVVVGSVTPSDEAEGPSDAAELESAAAVREEELRLFSESLQTLMSSVEPKTGEFTVNWRIHHKLEDLS